MLADDIDSCEDLFTLICGKNEYTCSFMIFQLPEDMSMEDLVRIDRGSMESEVEFRRILAILKRVRRFPCGLLHLPVELKIGWEDRLALLQITRALQLYSYSELIHTLLPTRNHPCPYFPLQFRRNIVTTSSRCFTPTRRRTGF
jgi:hypothetical protein